MSFGLPNNPSFSSTSTPSLGFGSTAKPTFGSTTTPAFGATGGSVFGASSTAPTFGGASTTPAFGAFGATSAAPAFGTTTTTQAFGTTGTPTFGATGTPAFGATSTAPAFGATSTAPTFGTGTSFGLSTFGSTGTTSAGLGGSGTFGTTNPTSGTTSFGGLSTFGSTSTPGTGLFSGFGQTTTTNTGLSFGTGLGTKPTTTTTLSWGTPAFGTTTTTPAFGATGTPTFGATGTPTFGATGTPAFGATSAAPTFGTTSTAPTFGATSTAPTFGTGTSFGLGTFGSTGTTSAGLGGFGTFGTTNPTSGATGFGGLSTFGNTSTPGTGLFSGFGQTTTANTGLSFGTGLGTKPTTTTLSWGTPAFGQMQPQQQSQIDPNQALYNAVFNCQVFGDERDRTLSRWNLVQALWGTGKGYYSQQAPPVEFTMKNPLCRFKAISYSLKPKTENKDGFVALIFNKKESEIRALESQLLTNLNNVLGNKPTLLPGVESIKAFSETKTLVIIYVQEKQCSGTTKKIPASELAAYLMQPMQRQQLTNLQVENIYPQVDPGQESLKEYLDNPPAGFDAGLWKQAQEDNPIPEKLIPVPLIGFADVRWRMKCQEQETALHQAFLDKIADEIADLQRKHTETLAKISEYRLKFSELQHRILKIMIIQEISRKMGLSLLPEEEKLKSRLEAVSATVNSAPFKSRLAKLTEEVKSHAKSNSEPQRYKMDSDVIAEIKQFLTMEQSGMTHVIDIIQSDLSDLKRIKDGMMKILQGQIQ